MKKNTFLHLIYLTAAIIFYYFIKGLDIGGVDIAYQKAFMRSNSINSFAYFTLTQGYPSISLWIYYLLGNLIGITYGIAHAILGILYIFKTIQISVLLKNQFQNLNKNIFSISLIIFFVFGQFGMQLLLSAEKMLIAMIFLLFALEANFKNQHRKKLIFYLLSFASHFTVIITIYLLEYESIINSFKNFLNGLKKLKLRKLYIYITSLIFIITSIGFTRIVAKAIRTLRNSSLDIDGSVELSGASSSYILLASSVFLIFFVLSKIKLKGLISSFLSLLPILIKLPLGRISWLYAFTVFLKPYILKSNIRLQKIYIPYILSLSLFYLYKSINIIQRGYLNG